VPGNLPAKLKGRSSMSQIVIELPKESLIRFNGSEERAGKELRMAAAAKLYEMRQISTGAAAELAGLPRTVFLARLAEYGVDTFSMDEREFDEEVRLA
jgi:predicted HTH domain antitoxin